MRQHLEAPCRPCTELAGLWQRARTAADRARRYEVAESAVRLVRAAFGTLQHTEKKHVVIPQLVFDSLWQPAAIGLRGSSSDSKPQRVIFRAAQLAIEMQIEPVTHSELLHVAGVISDAAKQGESLAEMSVVVSSPAEVVAQTITNRFGEFYLSFVPEPNLRICFAVLEGKELSIPLDGTGVRIFYRN